MFPANKSEKKLIKPFRGLFFNESASRINGDRSSRPKGVLENFAKSTGKHPVPESIFS